MNCEWGNWGEWSKCSMECGNGTQTSNRSKLRKAAHGGKDCIGNITKSQNCNEHPCDGKYLDIAYIFENINILILWVCSSQIIANCPTCRFGL